MVEARRPDPDALLAAVQKQEMAAQRGKLKIFFGMAAGVGKTYAMLESAQQRRTDGVDVVVGYVETHGRPETEALLQGLSIIPRQRIEYRGVALEEMDLDAILARRPQLVLVDELAHTNVPGSRHLKRYQDVLELLEAEIDVYTTLNVQHLESRADTVRQITGIAVRETVPDSIFEVAHDVELVDLAPEALRQRLAEGKVYIGDERAESAASSFFRQGNLTALREMALRITAERVDHQLQDYMVLKRIAGPWKSRERLMVAVSPSPLSERLVRWTRRMAYTLEAPWIAVHVETSHALAPAQQERLANVLALADELGAEVVTTWDENVVHGLLRIARERNVTQIVVGKPVRSRWQEWSSGALVDRLLRQSGDIDVYVVTGDPPSVAPRPSRLWPRPVSWGRQHALTLLVMALVVGLNWLALPLIGYRAVGLVLLFAVTVLAMAFGRGPALLAATLSALLWDLLFIPPRFSLTVSAAEDLLMLGTYFVVALITGTLAARLRAQEQAVRRRERRFAALYAFAHDVASARTLDAVVETAVEQIGQAFDAQVAVLLPHLPGQPGQPHPASTLALDEKELSVASWVHANRKQAGRFTDTLPLATARYLPLRAPGGMVGVLGIQQRGSERPTLDQETLLETFANQLALVIERTTLDAAAEQAKIVAESERLYRTLLNSVSHELRTPLTTITGAASSLLDPNIGTDLVVRQTLSQEINQAAARLNRIVENLLDMTRLESGRLRLNLEWCDVHDLVSIALNRARNDLADHVVIIDLASELPLIRIDLALMEQALYNLLHNAAVHTPPGTRVRITARVEEGEWVLSVADRGPGLPPEDLERVFDKFYRAPSATGGGTGLGLSITRGLVEAHGGRISAENRSNGGARFTIRLPLQGAPNLPQQESD
jgi:two-component system, OmpR family, sensor histidine kinase KdpD